MATVQIVAKWPGGQVDKETFRHSKGQSILEYLVMAAVVVAAVLAVQQSVRTNTDALYTSASGKVSTAAQSLTGLQPEVGQ